MSRILPEAGSIKSCTRGPVWFRTMINDIYEALGTLRVISNPSVSVISRTPQGTLLDVPNVTAGSTAANPWNATLTMIAGVPNITIRPGYIAEHSPTIGGVAINTNPAPTLVISLTGTQVIYLKLDVTFSTANGYVYQGDFVSAIIDVDASLPPDDTAAGTYYICLATYEDGVKQSPQPVLVNLTWVLFDKLLGTSEATVNFFGV